MTELHDVAEATKHHARLSQEAATTVEGVSVRTTCSTQKAIQTDIQKTMQAVVAELAADGDYDPIAVVRNGLSALSRVEARAFLIHNMLEAVKGGKGLTDTIQLYHKAGLTDIDPDKLQATADGSQPKNGSFLRQILRSLKKLTGIVVNMIVSAVRCGGKLAGVKPSIGLAAGFPSISFAIEPQAVDFTELWDILRASFDGASG